MLLCMDYRDSTNSFIYDKIKLLRFVKFYSNEFLIVELIAFEYQLDNYILNIRSNNQFFEIMSLLKNWFNWKNIVYIY